MAKTIPSSRLVALVRLSLMTGFTLPMMALQTLALSLKLGLSHKLPRWYHKQCCRILGIEVVCKGEPSHEHPTIYLANHVSYLDITALGSLIYGCFIAKAEVRSWPLFGWLARMQRTVFVERRRTRTADHRDELLDRMESGDDLILFPEGTSGDGNRVKPFKSALLSVAEYRPKGRPVRVQSVSIAYTRLDGLPLGRYLRPLFAWYGDMDLAPHLWQMAGMGRLTVEIRFHPPVTVDELGCRKALSDHCQRLSALGVASALTGRPMAAEEAAAPVPAS